MNITVFGGGYVGLVSACCLAEVGNHVVCMDVDDGKLGQLRAGQVPMHEPGLEELLARNTAEGRLSFTYDAQAAASHAEIVFIAVGTPPAADGSADLDSVFAVAEAIAGHLAEDALVVVKSTVPVGTTGEVKARIEAAAGAVRVASNPEFLKAGAAVKDFMKPDRIILGVEDEKSEAQLRMLYTPFNRNREKIIAMDIRSAELTKYAANALLATRISFMNELAGIAEAVGADVEQVRIGVGSDPRIGYHFIYPGAGYGGSCFPKDLRALAHTARSGGVPADLVTSVETVNERQKTRLFAKIRDYFEGELSGRTIAIWGLAFKPGTDDMREAPSRVLIEQLLDAGARVHAHDPVAMGTARGLYGERDDVVVLFDDPYSALDGADTLALVTEWKSYWSPDFVRIRNSLKHPVLFDGRNIYDPTILAGLGLDCHSIGRRARR